MNDIKFEWTYSNGDELTVHHCRLKNFEVGAVVHYDNDTMYASFGDVDAPGIAPGDLDEAKTWVEAQAREWLKEVAGSA